MSVTVSRTKIRKKRGCFPADTPPPLPRRVISVAGCIGASVPPARVLLARNTCPPLPRPPQGMGGGERTGDWLCLSLKLRSSRTRKSAALPQILRSGPLAEARARRNLSAYQNEIKPGKINVSLSDPCILILSREKASFSLSTRFRALPPPPALRAIPLVVSP